MNEPRASFVCGFGGLSAGIAGLAWDLADPGAVLLHDGRADRASFALEESGDAAALVLTAGAVSAEGTFAPGTAEIQLDGGPVTTVCTVEARFEGGGETVRCGGYICRWEANPLEQAATFRQLVVEAGPDALLVAVARGEAGTVGHGEERTGGWRIQGEEGSAFEESLISTQYGRSGDPTRLGLELWAADADQTSRAAATRVAGSVIAGTRSGPWAGFFRCHTDGTEGLGAYLLSRE